MIERMTAPKVTGGTPGPPGGFKTLRPATWQGDFSLVIQEKI